MIEDFPDVKEKPSIPSLFANRVDDNMIGAPKATKMSSIPGNNDELVANRAVAPITIGSQSVAYPRQNNMSMNINSFQQNSYNRQNYQRPKRMPSPQKSLIHNLNSPDFPDIPKKSIRNRHRSPQKQVQNHYPVTQNGSGRVRSGQRSQNMLNNSQIPPFSSLKSLASGPAPSGSNQKYQKFLENFNSDLQFRKKIEKFIEEGSRKIMHKPQGKHFNKRPFGDKNRNQHGHDKGRGFDNREMPNRNSNTFHSHNHNHQPHNQDHDSRSKNFKNKKYPHNNNFRNRNDKGAFRNDHRDGQGWNLSTQNNPRGQHQSEFQPNLPRMDPRDRNPHSNFQDFSRNNQRDNQTHNGKRNFNDRGGFNSRERGNENTYKRKQVRVTNLNDPQRSSELYPNKNVSPKPKPKSSLLSTVREEQGIEEIPTGYRGPPPTARKRDLKAAAKRVGEFEAQRMVSLNRNDLENLILEMS